MADDGDDAGADEDRGPDGEAATEAGEPVGDAATGDDAEEPTFGGSLPPGEPDATDRAVASLLDALSKRHALAMLAVFAADPGPWRFGELEETLDVPPDTLSARLEAFEEQGLVEREHYDENPPRVEYTATGDAEDLRPIFRRLYGWAEERGDDR